VRWRKERFGLLVSESGLKGAYPRFLFFSFVAGNVAVKYKLACSREKSGSVEIGRRWRRRRRKRWTSAKLEDEIQGHSHRLRRRTFGTPYVCSSHFLSVACMPVWFLVLRASPASLALFSCRHCYRCACHLCHSNLFWDSLWAWNSKGSKTLREMHTCEMQSSHDWLKPAIRRSP